MDEEPNFGTTLDDKQEEIIAEILEKLDTAGSQLGVEQSEEELLNVIDGPDGAVWSKRIHYLHFNKILMDTFSTNEGWVNFNLGPKTVVFEFSCQPDSKITATIDTKCLQSGLIKNAESENAETEITFSLISPLSLENCSYSSNDLDVKEIVMHLRDEINFDELQAVLQKMFPGKFKQSVKAIFHAEMNSEPLMVVDTVYPTPSDLKRKRFTGLNFNEIIPIPNDISWEIISEHLNDYKLKDDIIPNDEQLMNTSLNSTDTVSAGEKSDFSFSSEQETTKLRSEDNDSKDQSDLPTICLHSTTENQNSTQMESCNSDAFLEKSVPSQEANTNKRGAGEIHYEDETTYKVRKLSSDNEINLFHSCAIDTFDVVKSSFRYDKGSPCMPPPRVDKNYSKYNVNEVAKST